MCTLSLSVHSSFEILHALNQADAFCEGGPKARAEAEGFAPNQGLSALIQNVGHRCPLLQRRTRGVDSGA